MWARAALAVLLVFEMTIGFVPVSKMCFWAECGDDPHVRSIRIISRDGQPGEKDFVVPFHFKNINIFEFYTYPYQDMLKWWRDRVFETNDRHIRNQHFFLKLMSSGDRSARWRNPIPSHITAPSLVISNIFNFRIQIENSSRGLSCIYSDDHQSWEKIAFQPSSFKFELSRSYTHICSDLRLADPPRFRYVHVRETTQNARGSYQPDRGKKERHRPPNKPSVAIALFLFVFGLFATFLCSLRGGYHLHKKRSARAAIWICGGLLWGCLGVFVILNAF